MSLPTKPSSAAIRKKKIASHREVETWRKIQISSLLETLNSTPKVAIFVGRFRPKIGTQFRSGFASRGLTWTLCSSFSERILTIGGTRLDRLQNPKWKLFQKLLQSFPSCGWSVWRQAVSLTRPKRLRMNALIQRALSRTPGERFNGETRDGLKGNYWTLCWVEQISPLTQPFRGPLH